jgi:hypothetical protein
MRSFRTFVVSGNSARIGRASWEVTGPVGSPVEGIEVSSAKIKVGGIVLCGGRSSRMGVPKLSLPFGPELMLQRVVRLLSTVVDPIIVVAAPGQELPPLDPSVAIIRDRREARGPLEGHRPRDWPPCRKTSPRPMPQAVTFRYSCQASCSE